MGDPHQQLYFQVFQLPVQRVLTAFPELAPHWHELRKLWRTRRTDSYFLRCFAENAASPVAQELFTESSQVPDLEKYTALERDGLRAYFPDSPYVESRFLERSWILNRGKIAHYHLPSTDNFQAQGVFWYPNQGYREWHSNYDYENDQPSTEFRMYMIDVEEEDASFFYYLDQFGQLQRLADKAAVVNLFLFPAKQKFWHSVVSHTNRFSLGFRPNADQREAVIRLLATEAEQTASIGS